MQQLTPDLGRLQCHGRQALNHAVARELRDKAPQEHVYPSLQKP